MLRVTPRGEIHAKEAERAEHRVYRLPDAHSLSKCSYSALMRAFMWARPIRFQVIALKALIGLSSAHEVVALCVLDKQFVLKRRSA